ncbi:Ubiquitin-conjugating enzyme E2 14 [Hyphodiscus hymeniophilus]|uniref:Ubiquitin-conjugating enzyme E2 14 n=1 Tax=Hyphodiscus hymeniophilus TaxID=353542 RepID=A0A9P7AY57_9HELO|nr:Ubiquitin-conjugating enzyme E2 14 [Hyphodiscus hymeniophilus]
MASSQKRITKELAEVTSDPPVGIKVSLVDESNVHNWNVILDGPPDSPYAVCLLSHTSSSLANSKLIQGGKFKLLLVLPTEYPFKPPVINFKTRVYHPNITFDDKGSMCIGILKAEAWKPSSKILSVLTATQQLLSEPVPDDALESAIAEKFKSDRKDFNAEAKKYTKQYATGK